MRFSIIVPIYNVEQYLRECIDSILNQSYKDFELILVNDGSKDCSPEICDNYAMIDSRVKVIHKANGGATSARNCGVKTALGNYIIYVDGDDTVESDMLKIISDCIEQYSNPSIICFAHNTFFAQKFKPVSIKFSEGYYNKKQITEKIFPFIIRGENGIYFPPTLWGKAIQRELILQYQFQIDPRIKLAEDACIIIPCVYHASSVYILNKAFYNYRYNPNSLTQCRKAGFPWKDVELRLHHLERILPLKDVLFYDQICRSVTHALFNIAKSHLQTSSSYKEIKKDIKYHFSLPQYTCYIKDFKCSNRKEQLAHFAVKHKLVWLINLYAKWEMKKKK